jgi:hypothetical protein
LSRDDPISVCKLKLKYSNTSVTLCLNIFEDMTSSKSDISPIKLPDSLLNIKMGTKTCYIRGLVEHKTLPLTGWLPSKTF